MKKKDIETMFALARQLYSEEQENTGMLTPIPYCYVKNNNTGELLVFSAFGEESKKLLDAIQKPRGGIMEKTLALVTEQIEAGAYSYGELVQIIGSIIIAVRRDWFAEDSKCGELVERLEAACEEWNS